MVVIEGVFGMKTVDIEIAESAQPGNGDVTIDLRQKSAVFPLDGVLPRFRVGKPGILVHKQGAWNEAQHVVSGAVPVQPEHLARIPEVLQLIGQETRPAVFFQHVPRLDLQSQGMEEIIVVPLADEISTGPGDGDIPDLAQVVIIAVQKLQADIGSVQGGYMLSDLFFVCRRAFGDDHHLFIGIGLIAKAADGTLQEVESIQGGGQAAYFWEMGHGIGVVLVLGSVRSEEAVKIFVLSSPRVFHLCAWNTACVTDALVWRGHWPRTGVACRRQEFHAGNGCPRI